MHRRFGQLVRALRGRLCFYRALLAHPRTPRAARWCLLAALGYMALPFDIIPDFVPVLGHLDDLVIVPGLLALALWLIPCEVRAECRTACLQETG
jgi:uncharacterized membrane protein YkvA (DUF1232 family)